MSRVVETSDRYQLSVWIVCFAVEFSGLGVKGWPLLSVVQDDAGERGYGVVVSEESAVEMIWGAEQVGVCVWVG